MPAQNNLLYKEMIGLFIALIGAIPPSLAVFAKFRLSASHLLNRGRKKSHSYLKIVRIPVSYRIWKAHKRTFQVMAVLFSLVPVFFVVNTVAFILGWTYWTTEYKELGIVANIFGLPINLFVVINGVIGSIYAIGFWRAHERMGSSPENARHFLFDKAYVLIKGDYSAAVHYSCETLKSLGAEIIEISPGKREIEAYTNQSVFSPFGGFPLGGMYRILVTNTESPANRSDLEVQFLVHGFLRSWKIFSSRTVNRFLEELILS